MASAVSSASHGFVLNLRLIAETAQPMDLRLAPKPGHLPFGIVAVGLLSGLKRLLARDFSTKKLQRLLVAESRQRGGSFTILINQPLRLLHQPGIEHLLRAAVDSVIERLPVGIKTETQNAEAAQGVAPPLPQFRHLLSRRQAYLDGPDELGHIVGMNFLGSGAIQALQNAMQIIRAACCCALSQALSQFFGALRAGEKSFEQGAEVESGSAHQNRQMAAHFDLIKHLPRLAGIFAGRDMARGRDAIEQVMRQRGLFLRP